MRSGNKKTTIHVIESVKGGSGKTAFALRKAINVASENDNPMEKKPRDDNPKVIYIDADVHGSETARMLHREINEMSLAEKKFKNEEIIRYFNFDTSNKREKSEAMDDNAGKFWPPEHFLNTYMHHYKGYFSKINEIILPANLFEVTTAPRKGVSDASGSNNSKGNALFFKDHPKEEGKVDFIFADPCKKGRDIFKSQFQSGGESAIGVGFYLEKINNLLDYVVNKGYTDVIVDMPPGSDIFSDHLTDQIIELVTNEEEKCSLNIYYVVCNDINHIQSGIHAAIEQFHVMRSSSPAKIFFVYNEGRESILTNSDYKTRDDIINGINHNGHERGGLKGLFDETDGFTKEKAISELKKLNYLIFFRDNIYYDSLRNINTNKYNIFFGTTKDSNWDKWYIKNLN